MRTNWTYNANAPSPNARANSDRVHRRSVRSRTADVGLSGRVRTEAMLIWRPRMTEHLVAWSWTNEYREGTAYSGAGTRLTSARAR